MGTRRFRVAFSFAGEKRDFVEQVARSLAARFGEAAILYDKFHEAEFARHDLGIYLPKLYREESDLIVPVLSPDYDRKRWTGWEWVQIYGLLTQDDGQRVMPSRFGRANADGLSPAAGFIELDQKSPDAFAQLILQRLALNEGRPKEHYLSRLPAAAPAATRGVSRPRVYISYSWQEASGPERALTLANRLRAAGIDARVDLYYLKGLHGFAAPPLLRPGEEAWTRWQQEQIRDADRVVVVCGPAYAQSPADSGVARDVRFMTEDLQRPGVELRKFIPVGYTRYEPNRPNIPAFIRGANYYYLGRGSKVGGLNDLIRQLRNEFPPEPGAGSAPAESGDGR